MSPRLDPELPPINLDTLARLVLDWHARDWNAMALRARQMGVPFSAPSPAPNAPELFFQHTYDRDPELMKRFIRWQDILGRTPHELYGLGVDELQRKGSSFNP